MVQRLLGWLQNRLTLTPYRRGKLAEEQAASYLRRRGYRVIARNLKTPLGEIDLVAVKGEVMAFVEVKARSTGEFGSPLEAVTVKKQRRIRRAAEAYAAKKGWTEKTLRFDIIAVSLDERGRPKRIEHIPDAF